MTGPVAPARGPRRDLSRGAQAAIAALLAVVVLAAGLVAWRADSANAGASTPLTVLAWVTTAAGVAAPLAALVLGAIAVRTGSGRALGAVAVLLALVVLVLVGVATMG